MFSSNREEAKRRDDISQSSSSTLGPDIHGSREPVGKIGPRREIRINQSVDPSAEQSFIERDNNISLTSTATSLETSRRLKNTSKRSCAELVVNLIYVYNFINQKAL